MLKILMKNSKIVEFLFLEFNIPLDLHAIVSIMFRTIKYPIKVKISLSGYVLKPNAKVKILRNVHRFENRLE